MTDNEWQAYVTREAAQEIGAWLEARGGLDGPIRALSLRDLEAMASNAISRFIVLTSQRRQMQPDSAHTLIDLF